MDLEPIELTGQRAKLVPMHIDHIEGLFEAGRDDQIWTYMPMKIETIDDAKRLVEESSIWGENKRQDGYIS